MAASGEKRKLGFYGCNNRVVRLSATGDFPRHLRVSCPACKHEHDVHPSWRKVIPAIDSGKSALEVS